MQRALALLKREEGPSDFNVRTSRRIDIAINGQADSFSVKRWMIKIARDLSPEKRKPFVRCVIFRDDFFEEGLLVFPGPFGNIVW